MLGSNSKLVTDFYWGIEYNGEFQTVIQKYTKFPYKAKRYISTYEDNQTEIEVKVSFSFLPLSHRNISVSFFLFRCATRKNRPLKLM